MKNHPAGTALGLRHHRETNRTMTVITCHECGKKEEKHFQNNMHPHVVRNSFQSLGWKVKGKTNGKLNKATCPNCLENSTSAPAPQEMKNSTGAALATAVAVKQQALEPMPEISEKKLGKTIINDPNSFVRKFYGEAFALKKSFATGEMLLVASCAYHDCEQVWERVFNPNLKKQSLVVELRKKHWSMKRGGKHTFCPSCNKLTPLRLPKHWRAGKKPTLKPINPKGNTMPQASNVTKLNTPATNTTPKAKKAKREAMELLQKHFNDKGFYTGGYSDARIAQETRLSEIAVAEIRSDFFGELNTPPELQAVITQVEGLKIQLETKQGELAALREMLASADTSYGEMKTQCDLLCRKLRDNGLL